MGERREISSSMIPIIETINRAIHNLEVSRDILLGSSDLDVTDPTILDHVRKAVRALKPLIT